MIKLTLKYWFILLSTIFSCLYSYADVLNQNNMVIQGGSVQYNDTITIEVQINNDDEFVGLQLDFCIPSGLSYINSSAYLNPARSTNHTLTSSLLSGDTLRLICYSPTNDTVLGNSGAVIYFRLIAGTIPGNFLLTPLNTICGDISSTNILTSSAVGSVIIQAPDINLSHYSLDFNNVAVGDSADRSFTIYNPGNQQLQITDIIIDSLEFSVIGPSNFAIAAGGNQGVIVRFNSLTKGTYLPKLRLSTNDPDEDTVVVDLQGISYTVNEIHTGNMSAEYGDTVDLVFSIDNQEDIVSFQFDLTMHSPMNYINGTALLSTRKTNHIVSASVLPSGNLRVLAYSPDNDPFTGHVGEILTLSFFIEGLQGSYGLNLSNCIIGNEYGENVISAFYNGQLQIIAPDIDCSNTLDLGVVSVLDTALASFTINNTGADTLWISSLVFETADLFDYDLILPAMVEEFDNISFNIEYHNPQHGFKQRLLKIYSNDPDEPIKNVEISANVYLPNYASIPDLDSYSQDTVEILFDVDNYSAFTGFQFDLNFPSFMTAVTDSVKLTSRATDHVIQAALLDSVNLRVFAYSASVDAFIGDSGSVASLQFVVASNSFGSYPLTLSNVILVEEALNNVLYEYYPGTINILGPLNTIWTGLLSSDWHSTGNWSNGFPTEYSTVNISAATPFQPVINQDVSIHKLIMDNASTLEISNGKKLTITGK